MQLGDLDTGRFAIGKFAWFYKDAWDFNSNLTTGLTYLGFTEGESQVVFNETFNNLTLPEYTGDTPHKANVSGEAPEVTINLFLADPALRAIVSPTGSASGGGKRQRPVKEYTLVGVPEEIFLDVTDPTLQEDLPLTWDSAQDRWEVGSAVFTADQEELFGQSIWIWRGYFMKPNLTARWEEAGKNVEPTTFRCMYQKEAPVGSRIYYIGDPTTIVDVETGIMES